MNREQAKQALAEGKRISHRYFEDYEWVKQVGNLMEMEDGNQIPIDIFWHDRSGEHFNDGWFEFALLDPEDLFDEDGGICDRCGCCSTEFEECSYCAGEGGTSGEELMSEDPLWYQEDDFRKCDACNGKGGHLKCAGDCDEHGKHVHASVSE